MIATVDCAQGELSLDGVVVDKNFSEKFLLDSGISGLFRRNESIKVPFSEYVVSPVMLWEWRFSFVMLFKNERICQIQMLWMDGDLAQRDGWSEIVKADLAGDFAKLSNFIADNIGRAPSRVSGENAVWSYTWGNVTVWAEDRSFTEGVSVSWVENRESAD